MATPNNPVPPKKPTPTPAGKPPAPAADAKPAAAKPAADPKAAGGKPAAAKPAADPKAAGSKPAAGNKPAPAGKPAPASKKQQTSGPGKKIGQILVDLGFLDEEQLWELYEEARTHNQSVEKAAVSRGLITEDQMLQALGELHGLRMVNLEETKPQPEALQMVPETMASSYKVLPISVKDNVLTLATSDPSNLAALDDLRNLLGIPTIQPVLASAKAIEQAAAKAYAGKEESILDIIQIMEADPKLEKRRTIGGGREDSIDLDNLLEIQDAAPVRKLINMVFLLGIKDKASDIHFEPFEDEYKMRYRADGVLMEMVPPPRHLATAISSRIKVMANLDISERRLPQDGRIELNVGGNPVDMRVSTLPTMFGESVVVRILDRTVVNLDLEKIGLEQDLLAQFREIIHKPNGIVLVTGPTGSGKTTTLYSALSELNEITDKIITTEDPVEYEIDGIVQVPINAEIGMTFAGALRAILRQDPDRILVGEIRDLETAQIAVQAALTGHMVFSTLHTNDAPSTITRLRDMGVEPYLITACVEGILAQRLVRRICIDCRTEFQPGPDVLMELNLRPDEVRGKKFYYGAGCERCNNTGYKGRCGLYELIILNDDIRDLISKNASTDELRNYTRKCGARSLRESGLIRIHDGTTTIEEVVRETITEEES